LIKNKHEPVWLGREEGNFNGIKKFRWDPAQHYTDEKAFEGVEIVIHLAGAAITDKRWTAKYKKEIIDSRVKSSALLFDYISKHNYPVRTLVGASAVGYYGARQSNKLFTENDGPGNDFLAECCTLWENSYKSFIASGMRTTIFRTGIVLSKNGGAYPTLSRPFKSGVGVALASGKQYLPWIHINDLAAMYVNAALNNTMNGVYNAVAPELVTNKQFSKQLAKSLHRPFFLPNVPKVLLQLALGESAIAITEGLKISSQKIKEAGFTFEFENLPQALDDLAA
jgi:uncharacterized protein (TIGR01777 family)